MKFVAPLLVVALLGGCATPAQRPVVKLSAPFNEQQAKTMLEDGPNTIRGSAFLRQRGGGVVTCAGSAVTLVPATDYAKQRFAALYQGASVSPVAAMQAQPVLVPDLAEYRLNTKNATCDAQGNFAFERVADGDFFVTTVVRWQVGYAPQGGALLQRFQVRGGQTANIVLTDN